MICTMMKTTEGQVEGLYPDSGALKIHKLVLRAHMPRLPDRVLKVGVGVHGDARRLADSWALEVRLYPR